MEARSKLKRQRISEEVFLGFADEQPKPQGVQSQTNGTSKNNTAVHEDVNFL